MTSELTVEPSLPDNKNPALLYLARLSPGSRRAIRGSLQVLVNLAGHESVESFPWNALGYAESQALATRVRDTYSASYAKRHLSALRGVLRECRRLGLIDADTLAQALDFAPAKGSSAPAGRVLDPEEVRALFKACDVDQGLLGDRDAATLALLYGAGLRRAEAAALNREDFSPEDGKITVRAGKGQKGRIVYAQNGAYDAIVRWLAVSPVREGGEALLVGLRTLARLSGNALYDRCVVRAREAGVERFSPHDLRRTYATRLDEAGTSLRVTQECLGHASVATTQAYIRVGDRRLVEAASTIPVPYLAD